MTRRERLLVDMSIEWGRKLVLAEHQPPESNPIHICPQWVIDGEEIRKAAVARQLSQVKADRDEFEAKFVKASQEAANLKELNRQLMDRLNSCLDDLLPAQASARKWQEAALEEREKCAQAAWAYLSTRPVGTRDEVANAIRNRGQP